MQTGFFKNSTVDLLPAQGFLGELYNFCNFVIRFSLIIFCNYIFPIVVIVYSEMIGYYLKACSRNSKPT